MKKFTTVNELLTTEFQMDERIEAAISDAEKAFWDVISEKFPEVNYGVITQENQLLLDNTLSKVVKGWVYGDKPSFEE